MVAVLAGVQDGGDGLEGGLGDLREHSGLLAGLVPQDLGVERGEQAGFEGGRQARQHVPQDGELIQQGRVGSLRCGLGQGGELGFELLAFVMQLGEPGADPATHRGDRGVGRVGGQLFQFEDLGVLRGLDPLEAA